MKLTSKEFEVMELISAGFITKEVALKLKISPRTVESYVRKIYIKTGAKNRSNAVAIFLNNRRCLLSN